jgi:hypothetical protein
LSGFCLKTVPASWGLFDRIYGLESIRAINLSYLQSGFEEEERAT